MRARLTVGERDIAVALSRAVSLAIPLDFSSSQPRHFGAPPARSEAFSVPGFSGSVERGASCNCNVLTLIPHCNGTHTECVAHLTRERLDAFRVVPAGLIPAVLLTVQPVLAATTLEGTAPAPLASDQLITARCVTESWPATLPFDPLALVIRTLPNGIDKQQHDYTDETPPYLTRDAAELLTNRGIEHLVVDLPSIDRVRDEGRLTAHRIFFGLPPGAVALEEAARPRSTVTELAYIPDEVADGAYLLELQAPAIAGDAVPSRPMLYPLLPT